MLLSNARSKLTNTPLSKQLPFPMKSLEVSALNLAEGIFLELSSSCCAPYAAKFLVQVRGYTTDEDPMLCLNIKIDFLTRVLNKIGF